MIWKNPSEHVTGKIGVPSLVKFWMTPFQSCSRIPELTWKRQRSISAYFRSVSLASCVITRSPLPNVKRTLLRGERECLAGVGHRRVGDAADDVGHGVWVKNRRNYGNGCSLKCSWRPLPGSAYLLGRSAS